jgi:two-component system response regulator DevR
MQKKILDVLLIMKLFISYAHVDQPLCREIVAKLKAHEVWYDEHLYGAQKWWDMIQEKLTWCEGFIYLLSSESVQSEYCRKEFTIALNNGAKYIFPILIRAGVDKHPEFPPELRDYQWIDCSAGLTGDAVANLLNAIYVASEESLIHEKRKLPETLRPLSSPTSAESQTTVKILIADDHSVVRAGLRVVLEKEINFKVIAKASTGAEAIALAQHHHPDVAVLDIRMPGLSGIEACRQIVEKVKGCRVIMMTSYAEDELLLQAIQAGASGYVLKRIGDKELVVAVNRLARGENILDPAMTAIAFSQMRKMSEAQQNTAFAALTPKELAILTHIALGLTNRQIAVKLYLGEGTVRNYVSSILAKIGVPNRAEAAVYAVRHNLTDLALPDEHSNKEDN